MASGNLSGLSLQQTMLQPRVQTFASRPFAQQPAQCSRQQRSRTVAHAAAAGFGASASDQEKIKQARVKQLSTTDLLAQLLQAPDLEGFARTNIDSMSEEFFMMSSTYLEMAKREGNPEMVAKLETVLKACMSAKQATLRPEIQLLNTLLACNTEHQRRQVYRQPETLDRLTMNDRYFFTNLLDRMIKDVEGQKASRRQALLANQLKFIDKECKHLLECEPE